MLKALGAAVVGVLLATGAQAAQCTATVPTTTATVTLQGLAVGSNCVVDSHPFVNGAELTTANPMPVVQTGAPGLPTGAATAAGQVKAGIFPVGVAPGGGALQVIVQTYPSNAVVAGTIQFPNAVLVAGGCADANKMMIQTATAATNYSPNLELSVFGKPLVGTYLDGQPFNRNPSDVRLAVFHSDPTTANDGTGGTFVTSLDSSWTVCNKESTPTTTLYGVIATRSANYAPATVNDLAGGVSLSLSAK